MTAVLPATMEYKAMTMTGPMSVVLDPHPAGNRWAVIDGPETKSAFDLSADPDGTAWCIVAVTGIEDDVNDIIVPGAFRRTLGERQIKGVLAHSWDRPVAVCKQATELLPGDPRLPLTLSDGNTPWPSEAGALLVKIGRASCRERV